MNWSFNWRGEQHWCFSLKCQWLEANHPMMQSPESCKMIMTSLKTEKTEKKRKQTKEGEGVWNCFFSPSACCKQLISLPSLPALLLQLTYMIICFNGSMHNCVCMCRCLNTSGGKRRMCQLSIPHSVTVPACYAVALLQDSALSHNNNKRQSCDTTAQIPSQCFIIWYHQSAHD